MMEAKSVALETKEQGSSGQIPGGYPAQAEGLGALAPSGGVAGVLEEGEEEPESLLDRGPRALEGGLYSIQVPIYPAETECSSCELPFQAAGPTGHAGSRLICDLCLLEGCSELGMLLALASVTRAFGSLALSSREESRDALVELGAFARIYEQFAAKSGPPRSFRLPGDPR